MSEPWQRAVPAPDATTTVTAHLPRNECAPAVQERPADPDTILHRLRMAFPHYAFLHDPHTGTWTALRGPAVGGFTKVTRDPAALRIAVAEAESRRAQYVQEGR